MQKGYAISIESLALYFHLQKLDTIVSDCYFCVNYSLISSSAWRACLRKLLQRVQEMKKFNLWLGSIAVAVLGGTSQAQIVIGQTAGFTGPAAVSVTST